MKCLSQKMIPIHGVTKSISVYSEGFWIVSSADIKQVDLYDETGHVFKTIFHKYNERVRPYNRDDLAVSVNVDLSLVSVDEIDKKRDEIETVFDVVVSWEDARLYWYSDFIKYVTVNTSNIWTPDVAFLNAVRPPSVIINPRFVLVDSNGNVYWSQRVLLRTSCQLNQTSNAQECAIVLGSNQLPTQEQMFSNTNCTLKNSFTNSHVNISEMNMFKVVSPFKSLVFENANVSETHCMINFQHDSSYSNQQAEVEMFSSNGQDVTVSNIMVLVLCIYAALLTKFIS